jgi:hypothetical protein
VVEDDRRDDVEFDPDAEDERDDEY